MFFRMNPLLSRMRNFIFSSPLEKMLVERYLLQETPNSWHQAIVQLFKKRYAEPKKRFVFIALDCIWLLSIFIFFTQVSSPRTFVFLTLTSLSVITTWLFSITSIFAGTSVLGIMLGVMSLTVVEGVQRETFFIAKKQVLSIVSDGICQTSIHSNSTECNAGVNLKTVVDFQIVTWNNASFFCAPKNVFLNSSLFTYGFSPSNRNYIKKFSLFIKNGESSAQHIEKTLFSSNNNVYKIYIGKDTADSHGLTIGDQLSISDGLNFTTWPSNSKDESTEQKPLFEIAGFLESGIQPLDKFFAFTSAEGLNKLSSSIIQHEIWLSQKDTNHSLQPLPQNYQMNPLNSSINFAKKLMNELSVILTLVMVFLIILASFNLLSGIAVFFVDKSKQIAVLKALGMKESSIRRIFRNMGVRLGFLGVFLGTCLGIFLGNAINKLQFTLPKGVYPLSKISFSVSPLSMLVIMGLSSLIVYCCVLFAGRKTAKIPIGETFQKEDF